MYRFKTLLTLCAVIMLNNILIQAQSKNYEFINGQWFDGNKFVLKTMYTQGALLSVATPERIDSVIDISGKYVVPPFGDAHTHLIDPEMANHVNLYLQNGIYYVKDQGSIPMLTRQMNFHQYWNHPGGIDVPKPANLIFSAPGGHPVQIIQAFIQMGVLPQEWSDPKVMDGKGLMIIDDDSDIDRHWEMFMATDPGHVKTMLLYSEEYDKRKDDASYGYQKGLDPELVEEIAERAHQAGLKTTSHVYSSADFRHALEAGVDEIAHLPGLGYDETLGVKHFLISKKDAKLAANKGVIVITTITEIFKDEQRAPFAKEELLIPNLKTLKEHGVTIVLGSDQWRGTSASEAQLLSGFGIFTNLELLKMWCETTPKSIFPERKIGHLKDGHEASFLVLEGDPIEDFTNTGKIDLRFKQGEFILLN